MKVPHGGVPAIVAGATSTSWVPREQMTVLHCRDPDLDRRSPGRDPDIDCRLYRRFTMHEEDR
jgi:hypothetical protein